jgi:uncharacterized protein
MLINVQGIPEGKSALSQPVKIEGEQALWLVCKEDLECRAEIDRIPSRIAIHLFYRGAVELECSRCLVHFAHPVAGDFHVLLNNRSVEKKREMPCEDDIDFHYDDGTEEIDIRSAIFDDIITALPMKPVCRENCPGIYDASSQRPEDKKNRSEQDHSDPRWDALKKLKET